MMNFYYCPIRGLRYSYLGELYSIDISVIPQNMDIEDFLKDWKINWDTKFDTPSGVEVIGRVTNYIDI